MIIPVWFKKSHPTGLCTHVSKKTVDYYMKRDSHVFCCVVDFSKALDYVDYWLSFCKSFDCNKDPQMQLINRSVGILVQFSDCVCSLENVDSGVFHVLTGVRTVREACCRHICFVFMCETRSSKLHR